MYDAQICVDIDEAFWRVQNGCQEVAFFRSLYNCAAKQTAVQLYFCILLPRCL